MGAALGMRNVVAAAALAALAHKPFECTFLQGVCGQQHVTA